MGILHIARLKQSAYAWWSTENESLAMRDKQTRMDSLSWLESVHLKFSSDFRRAHVEVSWCRETSSSWSPRNVKDIHPQLWVELAFRVDHWTLSLQMVYEITKQVHTVVAFAVAVGIQCGRWDGWCCPEALRAFGRWRRLNIMKTSHRFWVTRSHKFTDHLHSLRLRWMGGWWLYVNVWLAWGVRSS